MLDNKIDNRIKYIIKTDPIKSREFGILLADVIEVNNRKFGINMNMLEPIEKIYHGCFMPTYKVIDKIYLNRFEATYNEEYLVEPLQETNDILAKKILRDKLEICLKVRNYSTQSTLTLLCKFILYLIGDPAFIELDEDITEEMINLWYKNIKLVWFMSNPIGLLSEKAGFDYYGLSFEDFMNSNRYSIENLMHENDFINESDERKLALRVELCLYAPYIIKNQNKILCY